jgi:AraC family transcriptional regulator, regulatory protein of adaptative response / methylated-DNA-[protein]-cysteine methyltransferase
MRRPAARAMLGPMDTAERQKQQLSRAILAAAAQDFELSVAGMAEAAGYSEGHFQRLFRRHFGLSPREMLRHSRIERFAEQLRQGMPVTQAAVESGFGSSSRVHQAAQEGLGMAPSRLLRGGAGECLHYALATSTLGRVLVAATEWGLCAVLLGDDESALERELARRFPKAERLPADTDFQAVLDSVVALIDQADADEPAWNLDLRGTLFQQKVWAALRAIPRGRTLTYGELARQVGLPGGARAVAQACGANPAAVVVPCHRVVAADGGLGGYRWGIERKRALLKIEADT